MQYRAPLPLFTGPKVEVIVLESPRLPQERKTPRVKSESRRRSEAHAKHWLIHQQQRVVNPCHLLLYLHLLNLERKPLPVPGRDATSLGLVRVTQWENPFITSSSETLRLGDSGDVLVGKGGVGWRLEHVASHRV